MSYYLKSGYPKTGPCWKCGAEIWKKAPKQMCDKCKEATEAKK